MTNCIPNLQCEEVCRRALMRRYRLLPHIYTLFYLAHTKGIPVATPTFFIGKSFSLFFFRLSQ